MEERREVIGASVKRVDAFDKVTGYAKYTDDLCDKGAYIAKILHSTVANGRVTSIDADEARKIPGVIKVVTCFDVPKNYFPTAGHPWSTQESHQDVADRLMLTDRVRFYGDDVAAVIAEDEVAASQALRAIQVQYEEYPFVLDVQEAMEEGAPRLHEEYPGNVLKHTSIRNGNYEEAIKETGLIKVEGWYDTPSVQHCHIENFICYAYQANHKMNVVSSTQIPHIVRRVVGQALGVPWGKVRVIKPYIGGGFGNKQDVLYEPLNAFLTTQVGVRGVRMEISREEPLACYPKPYYILCQAGRDIRGQETGGVLQSGSLRVPWSQRSGKGNGRVPAAVSLPECGGRFLYGIYQPPGGRRHERIWDSPGYVCRGKPHGRRGKGDWHVPAGIQEKEPDAERIRGWIL